MLFNDLPQVSRGKRTLFILGKERLVLCPSFLPSCSSLVSPHTDLSNEQLTTGFHRRLWALNCNTDLCGRSCFSFYVVCGILKLETLSTKHKTNTRVIHMVFDPQEKDRAQLVFHTSTNSKIFSAAPAALTHTVSDSRQRQRVDSNVVQ